MYNVYLFQPQYTTVINGRINNWIPYSVGALWAYASQFEDIINKFVLKDIIFQRENIEKLVERMENPTICAFSCYLWNKNYCLSVAQRIKEKWPNCIIVFGGPEVSSRILQNKFISTIVLGEGEENFVDILRNIIDHKPPAEFLPKTRMTSLDMPSPYLIGVFDDIIRKNPDVMWAMTLETNRGCPYSCSFCDWGSLTYSKVKRFELDKIAEEINWIKDKPISYVYVADANFGMFKERDLKIAEMLKLATDNSSVDLISVQNAKQSTEVAFEIGRVLGDKYAGVSIAMQSMNPDTLEAIHRKNLNTNNVKELLSLSQKYQVPTYTEMILGMPNETFETWCKGLTDLLELGQHNTIEIWFTQLLENSELSQPTSRLQYKIKSIISKNYISLKVPSDWNDLDEDTELICSTNTMSTEQMIDSYMFGWMIVQLHGTGYSQIFTRYINSNQQVSYLEIYNHLFVSIPLSKYFSAHFNKVRNLVRNFLHTGIVESEATGHMLHAVSSSWLYLNRRDVINQLYTILSSKFNLPAWVFELQHAFVYDEKKNYPIKINGNYNIYDQIGANVEYTINSKITEINSLTTASMRRRGLIKNLISISRIDDLNISTGK